MRLSAKLMSRNFFSKLGLGKNQGQKKKPVWWINLFLALIALYASWMHHRSGSAVSTPRNQRSTLAAPVPDLSDSLVERFAGQIERNMTLSDVLSSYDLPHELMEQLVVSTKPIYDLKKLLVGNRFELERLPDGTLKQFLYEIGPDKNLKVYLTDEGYKAALEPIQYQTRVALIAGTIQNSLFQTITELKERDQLALDLSEIFSWDLDFSCELRRSDHFKVAVEKRYLDGKFVKYGRILAAEFANRGRLYSAFYFADGTNQGGYYDAAGQSLKRDFLRAPVKFSRITSAFSRRRFHPLLKEFRPHMGVDYAAPAGTLVFAAGDGRVRLADWRGGLGRSIEIEHRNGLATMYGHLSRFARGIRPGVRVAQGEVIGYVGASGLATGPHLDYRVTRNGRFVNPLAVKFEPSTPLKAEWMADFVSQKEKWQSRFGSLEFAPPPQLASAKLPTDSNQVRLGNRSSLVSVPVEVSRKQTLSVTPSLR
jgi:murein DD-endopeptidase MepM/ murein hydrolase activator NlpD